MSDQASARLTARELCDMYGDRVYRFAAMVSRDSVDADDIAQDALMRAVRALPRFRPVRGGMEAWLWTIVVNVARQHRRLAFRREEVWDRLRQRERLASAPAADVAALAAMGDPDLVEAVRSLPARSRAAIALRFGADLEFAEVARQLRVSEPAARMAVHRGLQALRSHLKENAIER